MGSYLSRFEIKKYGRLGASIAPHEPLSIIRLAYYAFVLSIPFEGFDLGSSGHALSKLTGYIFVLVACLQPRVAFRRPPRAYWYFAIYLFIWGLIASQDEGTTFGRMRQQFQMLTMFWMAHNLMRYRTPMEKTPRLIALATVCLAILQALGVIGGVVRWGQFERSEALGMDSNTFAGVLSVGLLALVGVVYGRSSSRTERRVAWLGGIPIAVSIILTGSRGALLSVMAGLLVLLASRRIKVQTWMIVLAIVLGLGWFSFRSEVFSARWERTLIEGSLSGRERIYPEALRMFLEEPVTGWGPERHVEELGYRFGRQKLDTHNLYLWVLTETGLLGAIPFFLGIVSCWGAAWSARNGKHGSLPMSMLLCVTMINMVITWHNRKLYWLVLAYGLASANHQSLRVCQRVVWSKK